ncbi:MAG: serine/threonine protein kinase [Myxococcaceae bacterium]|nr:serine/threonine protein kinase [Myxococcaceae bacterium]
MTAAGPPADLVGQRIDDYEVISRLGGGGMGVVYEAKDKRGTRVAIKTLKPVFANDKELVGRFHGEARALKAISHRAMVDILSIGELGDGTHYMVMEFLEGRTFEDVIKQGAPLDPHEVMSWMVEVLDALEAVHAAGVIHRDLKPSNLWLARTDVGPQVKLIDFGIAKHTGKSSAGAPQTLVSAIVGTPDYISPEQVNGENVTFSADLYALGVVMFEMLTGKLPFEEESSVKMMLMHVERPAPLASTRLKTIPKGIDELIAWTLNKAPADRPPSARALKERILSVMAKELGGRGPATTQVKALRPEREEATAVVPMPQRPPKRELGDAPAVTEPSMPAVQPPEAAPRIRRARTEPVPRHPAGGGVPMWAIGVGLVVLLGLVIGVVWKLTRPKPLAPLPPVATQPTPVVPPPEQPAPAPVAPPPAPAVAQQVEPKPPPDRPVPKRKKPPAPARKKHAGAKRK